MKLRLRKPQEIIWVLAILLVIVAVVLFLGLIPIANAILIAFGVAVLAALLMVLGTSVF